jgi:hypothetical protein
MSLDPLAAWHRVVESRDPGKLDALLAESVIFHSPVVHTPQVGKAITTRYLRAALRVFVNDSFRYVRELRGAHEAALEFQVEIQGVLVNGVDLLTWNEEGRLVELKVMIRPLQAIQLIHQAMGQLLQGQA